MNEYGYAICYRDRAGFTQPLINEHSEVFLILKTEKKANEILEIEKRSAYKKWRPEPKTVTTGMLWWKKTYNVAPDVSPVESALGRQIYNTIHVRKVKVV